MNITIHSQNLELSHGTREYVDKKLNKLSRYFEQIGGVEVHTSSQRGFKTVEVTLHANGRLVRAEERATDVHEAVDLVIDKLETQLKHYKERIVDRNRRPQRHARGFTAEQVMGDGALITELPVPPPAAGSEPGNLFEPTIIRRKQFAAEMMSAEEAAERMHMLGHNFFVFLDDETQIMNVVYERRDGGYGVLQPQVEAA